MSMPELMHVSERPRRFDIFTGGGRRRRFTAGEKAAIVAESYTEGTSASLLSQKCTLAVAIRYATSRWDGLTLYLDDGRVEKDSNAVERSIRPLVHPRVESTSSVARPADRAASAVAKSSRLRSTTIVLRRRISQTKRRLGSGSRVTKTSGLDVSSGGCALLEGLRDGASGGVGMPPCVASSTKSRA